MRDSLIVIAVLRRNRVAVSVIAVVVAGFRVDCAEEGPVTA